jgi:threonylcarbamoyladenosine tRNA methylthiotransferase MtaB
MSVDVQTFGCRLNTFESEVMRTHAEAGGLENAVIFNTCAVTAEATRQARQAIRKAKLANPDAHIIVTGCAAQTEAAVFAAMPEVARIVGNEEKLKPETWRRGSNAPRVDVCDIMQVRQAQVPMIEQLTGRTRAFVQVQNGCDHRCTFCIIPFGRGNSRSVPAAHAVAQVKRFAASGHNEVVLSGVDLTSWGADLEGQPKLGALVAAILKAAPELKRLRLSSIDSIEADEELVEILVSAPQVMPHLHLSLQSGDDMILKRMKRRHSAAQAVDFCNRLRARRPDMVFGADLIAGFPTETDQMFENSLRTIDDCGLTYLHVFPYSAREGTPAARMPAVDGAVIKRRAARLRERGRARLDQFLADQVGQLRQVLVETPDLGRTEHFAPVQFAQRMRPGAIVTTRISGVAEGALQVSAI